MSLYTIHAADGFVLAAVECPVEAHRRMRSDPAAVEWRNTAGVTCGVKRAKRRGEPGVFVLPTRSHRRVA